MSDNKDLAINKQFITELLNDACFIIDQAQEMLALGVALGTDTELWAASYPSSICPFYGYNDLNV